MNGTGIFLCNFSGMIKNALPSLRQGPTRKGSAADKKASAAALPVTPSRKPRTCGEKLLNLLKTLINHGSPPHVRGKAQSDFVAAASSGITPACAGKSAARVCRHGWFEDHPRMCEEKRLLQHGGFQRLGSPPHVRGKGLLQIFIPEPFRITPAYAGKSSGHW